MQTQIGKQISMPSKGMVSKEKMVESFGDDWRTKTLEGVISGIGPRSKICVKWMNLHGQPEGEYASHHRILRKLCEDGSKNPSKMHGPRSKSRSGVKTNSSGVNESQRGSHCPFSISSSESELDPDASAALIPLHFGEKVWNENPSLNCHQPRTGAPCQSSPHRMTWSASIAKRMLDYFIIFLTESFLAVIIQWKNANSEESKPQSNGIKVYFTSIILSIICHHSRYKQYPWINRIKLLWPFFSSTPNPFRLSRSSKTLRKLMSTICPCLSRLGLFLSYALQLNR